MFSFAEHLENRVAIWDNSVFSLVISFIILSIKILLESMGMKMIGVSSVQDTLMRIEKLRRERKIEKDTKVILLAKAGIIQGYPATPEDDKWDPDTQFLCDAMWIQPVGHTDYEPIECYVFIQKATIIPNGSTKPIYIGAVTLFTKDICGISVGSID